MANKIVGLFNNNKSPTKTPVQNMIGRVVYIFKGLFPGQNTAIKNIDETIPNYAFWDKFRNCQVAGYELAGIYAQGLIEIISSWVISRSVTMKLAKVEDTRMVKKVEYTNDLLRRFFLSNQGDMLQLYEDVLALGDQYAIVNPDCTITYVPPDMVVTEYDPLDFRKPSAYEITTNTDDVSIVDRYELGKRTLKITKNGSVTVKTFNILIDRIPIVHFANDKGRNEQHGHPIYETLRQLLSEYNDTLKKGLQGSKVAGNPIPVIENLTDPELIVWAQP